MPRDDDEVPDPRHARAAFSTLTVALIAGAVLIVVVLGGGFAAYLFMWSRAGELRDAQIQANARAAEASEARATAPTAARPGPKTSGPALDYRAEALKDVFVIDGLTVRVVSVEVGKAKILRDKKRNLFVEDDERSLLVRIELSVTGTAKKYSYATWRSEKSPAATDDLANTYGVRPITVGGPPGWLRTAAIGDKVTDTLAFRPPAEAAKYIDLDLPGANAGVAGTFQFRISRAAWEK